MGPGETGKGRIGRGVESEGGWIQGEWTAEGVDCRGGVRCEKKGRGAWVGGRDVVRRLCKQT